MQLFVAMTTKNYHCVCRGMRRSVASDAFSSFPAKTLGALGRYNSHWEYTRVRFIAAWKYPHEQLEKEVSQWSEKRKRAKKNTNETVFSMQLLCSVPPHTYRCPHDMCTDEILRIRNTGDQTVRFQRKIPKNHSVLYDSWKCKEHTYRESRKTSIQVPSWISTIEHLLQHSFVIHLLFSQLAEQLRGAVEKKSLSRVARHIRGGIWAPEYTRNVSYHQR